MQLSVGPKKQVPWKSGRTTDRVKQEYNIDTSGDLLYLTELSLAHSSRGDALPSLDCLDDSLCTVYTWRQRHKKRVMLTCKVYLC